MFDHTSRCAILNSLAWKHFNVPYPLYTENEYELQRSFAKSTPISLSVIFLLVFWPYPVISLEVALGQRWCVVISIVKTMSSLTNNCRRSQSFRSEMPQERLSKNSTPPLITLIPVLCPEKLFLSHSTAQRWLLWPLWEPFDDAACPFCVCLHGSEAWLTFIHTHTHLCCWPELQLVS